VQGRARTQPLRLGPEDDSIICARPQFGLKRQLRGLAQRAAAHNLELFEPSLCALELFLGLAPTTGGAQ
jgi:hypothetical protein